MKANSRSNTILEAPNVDAAYQAVVGGTSKHKMVIITGNCWVDYQGRASSTLEPGERIVILKPAISPEEKESPCVSFRVIPSNRKSPRCLGSNSKRRY